MGKRACGFFLVALCVSFVAAFAQRTLVVPVDYSTIEDAIEAALPGDVIEVFGGIYGETLVITKSLTILGIPKESGCGCGERPVLIMPRDRTLPAIQIETGGEGQVILEELVIRGAKRESAIKVTGSGNLVLDSCRILENEVGLGVTGNCKVSVRDCEFKTNGRYGLWFAGNTSFTVEGCALIGSAGAEDGAALLVSDDAFGLAQSCSIQGISELESLNPQDLQASLNGDGIRVEGRACISVLECEIKYNRKGIVLMGGTEVLVKENTFAECAHGSVVALSVNSEMTLSIIGNTVGNFGAPPVGCCPLVVLGGSFDSPIAVSDNVIGDIGRCAPFDLYLESCQEVFNSELKFEGTITGRGNILSASYQGPDQCPAWKSPFWPEDFLKESVQTSYLSSGLQLLTTP